MPATFIVTEKITDEDSTRLVLYPAPTADDDLGFVSVGPVVLRVASDTFGAAAVDVGDKLVLDVVDHAPKGVLTETEVQADVQAAAAKKEKP